MRFHVILTVVVVVLCGEAAAQCYTSSFICLGATTAAASFENCCRPVVANNNLERSFSMPGGHCQSCIVLGLDQSQYTLSERISSYNLRLRLLSPTSTLILGKPRLRLLGVPGTASVGDFRVVSSDILISSVAGLDVAVTISNAYDIAGEPNETFTITSQPPLVSGTNDAQFLFRDSVITIIDNDEPTYQFSQGDYVTTEGPNAHIEVVVEQIVQSVHAHDVHLLLTPLTYAQYIARSNQPSSTLPPIDQVHGSRPFNAHHEGDRQDFNNSVRRVFFPANSSVGAERRVDFPVFDDVVDEDPEGFIIVLDVDSNLTNVTVAFTPYLRTTLGRINDDDPFFFGFEQDEFVFNEIRDEGPQDIIYSPAPGNKTEKNFIFVLNLNALQGAFTFGRNGDIDFGTDGDIRPTFVFVGTPSFPVRFITIDVNADNVVEGQEIGLLTIAPSTSFNGFTPRFQSVRIIISDLRLPPVIENGTRYNSSVIQIGYGPHCLTTHAATITCKLTSGTVPITFSWSLPNSTIIAGGGHLVVSLPGKYSCTATNDFGNDSASSEVIVAPCVDFFGMISKQTGNGCSRLRQPLSFGMSPDMCAYVGDRVHFTCTLAGKGEVTAPLISSPGGTVIITGLVIEAIVDIEQRTASGGYDCSFSTVSANGPVNRTIHVEVFDPPKINTMIPLPNIPGILVSGFGRQNLSVIPGSKVQLFCPATGIPTPNRFVWSISSLGELSEIIGSHYTNISDIYTKVLTIKQKDNFTEYSCTAINIAGDATSTVNVRTLIINRANYPGPPDTELDEDNTIIIGDSTCIPINGSVHINCSTYQNNLVYQWSKDGEVVTNPNPPNILTVTERGNYTCTATNSASTENATSWIEVTPPSISFQIMSTVSDCSRLTPVPVNVTWCPRLYNRVDFQCAINIPGQTPLITFNGTPFAASYIESFKASNNGMYRCSFQNTCGTSTEVEINVQAFQPAKVDITTDLPLRTWSVVGGAGRSDIRVSIGGNVTLYCPTTGIDIPNTRWLLNGTTMVSNFPRVVITNETVNDIPAVVLTITNITTSDLVIYTCVTSNSDGTDTQNITIRDIDSFVSTSRISCGSSCLATLAANLVPSNAKPSSPQAIVSPSIPALESVPITATVISSTLGGVLIFISVLVAVTVFIVLRAKWQRKKIIDVLEQDFQRRTSTLREQRYEMPFGHVNDGFDKITSVPQIRPETLPLIGSAIILGRDIQLLDKIGQGEFGVVYKANFIGYNNGRGSMSVAVKTMQACCTEDDLKAFLDESLKMKELCHPNVMNLLGVCLDAGPTPYIVLPFMENGDLLSYIKKHRESLLVTECDDIDKISEVRIKLFSMCLQIAKGMEYLASQNIIHRDLAARNCMIDGCGMVKVADFGLSKSTYEKLYFRQEKSDNVRLPIKWLAVECIEDGVFSEKTDVWAFGVTCWEVFSGGKMPYGGLSPLSLSKLLKDGERMEAPDNAACSQEIYQTVMYQCWHGNPDERPTFSQLQTKISAVLSSMADYLEFSEIAPCDEIDEEKIGCQEFTIVASTTPSTPDRKTSTGCLLKPRDV